MHSRKHKLNRAVRMPTSQLSSMKPSLPLIASLSRHAIEFNFFPSFRNDAFAIGFCVECITISSKIPISFVANVDRECFAPFLCIVSFMGAPLFPSILLFFFEKSSAFIRFLLIIRHHFFHAFSFWNANEFYALLHICTLSNSYMLHCNALHAICAY